uniref:Conserved plasma membrane protein n=1 Tax=Steinernema glaseri TaxID=37863 RepID=A0A1I7ZAC4_9BILA
MLSRGDWPIQRLCCDTYPLLLSRQMLFRGARLLSSPCSFSRPFLIPEPYAVHLTLLRTLLCCLVSDNRRECDALELILRPLKNQPRKCKNLHTDRPVAFLPVVLSFWPHFDDSGRDVHLWPVALPILYPIMKTFIVLVALLAVALAQYNTPYTYNANQNSYGNTQYNPNTLQRDQTYGYNSQYTTQGYASPYGNQRFNDPQPFNGAATNSVMLATALTVIAARFF